MVIKVSILENIDGRFPGNVDDKFLKITVKDTGIGISKVNQNKLFKLFGYIKSKSGVNQGGIGLGLLISKKICEQFGGFITMESQEDIGSSFSFVLKLIKPNDIDIL